MDPAVIKIRYRVLEPGTNADAVREESQVIVYFVPGLSSRERKAALRRLRQASRRGQKPPLPATQLGFALVADRARMSMRNLAAIVRLHPAGSIVPVFGLASLIVLFLLTSVSVHILHGPSRVAGSPPALGSVSQPLTARPGATRMAVSVTSPGAGSRTPSATGGVALASGSGTSDPSGSGSSGTGSSGTGSSSGDPGSGSSGSGTPSGGSTPSPAATTGVSANVSLALGAAAAAAAVSAKAAIAPGGVAVNAGVSAAGIAASAHVGTTATPHPTSPSATCVDIGPLGICLSF